MRVQRNIKPPAPLSPNATREERDAHMARVIAYEDKVRAIDETKITFTKTDGSKLVTSAESMTYASPTKGGDLGNPNGATGILIGLNVSSQGPVVTKLRAAAGKAPDLGAAQHTPPTIQPGERIVIAWDQQDADTAAGALSAILYLAPPKAPDNLASVATSIPFAINLVGGQATLQASQLAGLPGDYGAKIVISDGVNTTSFSVGKLFAVREGVYLPIARR